MKNQGMKEKYVERFHRLLEDNKRLQNQVTMLQQELSKKVTRVDSNEMGDLREYCSAFDECSDRVEELAAWIMKENKVKQKEVKLEVKDPLENEKMSVECLKKCLNQRIEALELLKNFSDQIQNSLIRRNSVQQSTIEFLQKQPSESIRPPSPELKRTQRSQADRKIIQNYENKMTQQEQQIRRLTAEIQKIQNRVSELQKKNQRLLDERSDARAQVKDLQAKIQKLQSLRKQQIIDFVNKNTKQQRKSEQILRKSIDSMSSKISQLQMKIKDQDLTIRLLQAGQQNSSLASFQKQLKETMRIEHEETLQRCLQQQKKQLKQEYQSRVAKQMEATRDQTNKLKEQYKQYQSKHQKDMLQLEQKHKEALYKVNQLESKLKNTLMAVPQNGIHNQPQLHPTNHPFQQHLMPYLNYLITVISL